MLNSAVTMLLPLTSINIASMPASTKLVYLTYLIIGATTAFLVYSLKPVKSFKMTYSISGLHCPRCTATVEKSVKSIMGMQSVKVDWETKNARIEFDRQKVSIHQIAERIANTSHMFGPSMRYFGIAGFERS